MKAGFTGPSFTSGRGGSGRAGIGSNSSRTLARTFRGSTSPTMTSMALFGTYQVSWNFLSISPVVFLKDSRVPSGSWA